jgi:folate-binding protein YgfZ
MQLAEATIDAGYLAATQTAAWYRVPQPGTLVFGGATRVDYLQRQTTNDLGLLTAARALPNVLTNASGRILEVFTLLQLGEQIALLTQPGHAVGLAAYFKKNLFFNDQVTIEDASAAWLQIELRGPQAAAMLSQLDFDNAPSLDEVASANPQIHVIGIDSFDSHPALLLIAPSPAATELTSQLSTLGAAELSTESRELLRIEAGLAGDPEFTDANTPFEVGLARYVSDSKGCYTGQEVLARQITYDKIVRSLAKLSAEAPVAAGAAVSLDGKAAGQVSSAAVSPVRGPLALAVLRKPFETGETVSIKSAASSVSARIM